MGFTIIPIGVGGAYTLSDFHTNYLIKGPLGSLLFDCGGSALTALNRLGLALVDIDAVYISHLHNDHIGGLADLASLRYFGGKSRPRLYLHESLVHDLWEHYLRSMLGHYSDAAGEACTGTIDTFFEVHRIVGSRSDGGGSFKAAGLALQAVEVDHVKDMPSHGVLIEDTVFITSDTSLIPEVLEELVEQCEIEAIFHDCSFRAELKIIHATYEELLTLPKAIRKRLILTHFADGTPIPKERELLLGERGREYRYSPNSKSFSASTSSENGDACYLPSE